MDIIELKYKIDESEHLPQNCISCGLDLNTRFLYTGIMKGEKRTISICVGICSNSECLNKGNNIINTLADNFVDVIKKKIN